ncbi:Na/Pi symporter [Persicobacter diffluens]|uniref:Sodium:phosphate symporter n=1 Tax=Persicobacter diffluens TaxID=981 RepID=A0AAN4VZY6_9BACT|nr:sodium:phosphate symporter [Persicobacter diffluens]
MKDHFNTHNTIIQATMMSREKRKNVLKGIISILATLILFAFSLELMVKSFSVVEGKATDLMVENNFGPFVGLFVGLLGTAILQSSSTVTSAVVAVVAAGSISFADAVPMILGANIGTTLTSTLVSLGFISDRKSFQRAISAASMHDLFNILTVIMVLPLEYFFQTYTTTAQYIAAFIPIIELDNVFFLKWLSIEPLVYWLINVIDNGPITIIFSMVLLFASIKLLAKIIYRYLDAELKNTFQSFFKTEWKSFGTGTVLTLLVQSSSLTTSLIVPLAATKKVGLSRVFPYILGCNLGTTITALMVGLFLSPTALAMGLVHFLFNLTGVIIFMPIKAFRHFAVNMAIWLGKMTVKYRAAGLLYLIITFFIAPFLLIYFNQ